MIDVSEGFKIMLVLSCIGVLSLCLGVISYIIRLIVVEHLRAGRIRKYYRENCKENK